MKALVYGGPGKKSCTDAPDPRIIHPTDAVVRIDTTTICGTDLHILKGDVPAVQEGRVLGHEGVGTVTRVGPSVTRIRAGDRVIISCIKSCGHCTNCKRGLYSHCAGEEGLAGTGWIFGHLMDGTQAEQLRVPYADNSLHKVPHGVSDDQAVMLSDILPTAFEIGIQAGHISSGDTVAVVGPGPIGLAAMATAGLHGAATVIAIDLDESRLARAREFGATDTVNPVSPGWIGDVMALTDGARVDVAIEAVGIPDTFDMALRLVRPGGNVAIPAEKFATHQFPFDRIMDAYDTFSRAAETHALKVILSREKHQES
ncbi:alcohol dehydrogenase catalytic domain-containing protein [Arthrobacter sp. Soil762]|uniref:alcohol dehydrogenase catalytic domain-containing protein n=1 Tax=Arthrobacter sp. Soil762 TaxID=1736401 RepID=UPI0006F54518|nr:alcohol dehydrogenase catalytic domain-containing protein [Arthrobacter sp. Soil762]KRE80417.1 alcohol dehydrogenase [Arthrobacter sp. Soil762]